jgi:3-dehydroquinate synthase
VIAANVPAGEASKQHARYAELLELMVQGGLTRGSTIVALGGGMVGDLAGFVAATLYRGIAVVQLPTTVLAMVDSAIGGKTGINIAAGKNLVGAFWQPRAVIADPAVLATLPARELRAAFGELVKYGLLDGEPLLDAVAALAPLAAEAAETARPGPLADPGRRAALTRVIARCAAYKSWVVARDERERSGERALLNLGHTVGHAIEAAADYTVLHGEAVALGLLAACRVSAHLGRCGPALEARVADILARAGLDVALDPWLRPDVLSRIGVDKKRAGSQVKFIVPEAVGRCVVEPLEITAVQRIFTGAPRTAPTA